MVVVMRTGHKHKHPLEEGLEHINPIKAQLLNIFGPADGRGNPLVGQKIETQRRHERWARQEQRRHAHAEHRHSHAEASGAQPQPQEHSTRDSE
jgi:hypothetical protein